MKYIKIPVGDDGNPKISNNMKAKFLGEFTFSGRAVGEDGNDHILNFTVPWTTCKDIYKEMVTFAVSEKEQAVEADAEKSCGFCITAKGRDFNYCDVCGRKLRTA